MYGCRCSVAMSWQGSPVPLSLEVLVNETPAAQLDKRDTFLALGEDW